MRPLLALVLLATAAHAQDRPALTIEQITQADLGFEAGVGRVSVTMMETGRRLPTLPTLFRLADALGTSPEALVSMISREMAGGAAPTA